MVLSVDKEPAEHCTADFVLATLTESQTQSCAAGSNSSSASTTTNRTAQNAVATAATTATATTTIESDSDFDTRTLKRQSHVSAKTNTNTNTSSVSEHSKPAHKGAGGSLDSPNKIIRRTAHRRTPSSVRVTDRAVDQSTGGDMMEGLFDMENTDDAVESRDVVDATALGNLVHAGFTHHGKAHVHIRP